MNYGIKIVFTDHQRRAKRRMVGIQYAKGEKQRQPLYKDLLKVTPKTIGYAIKAEELLGQLCSEHQTVSRFPVQGVESILTIDNGISVELHDFIPVKTTT